LRGSTGSSAADPIAFRNDRLPMVHLPILREVFNPTDSLGSHRLQRSVCQRIDESEQAICQSYPIEIHTKLCGDRVDNAARPLRGMQSLNCAGGRPFRPYVHSNAPNPHQDVDGQVLPIR
jgi:hypothetical protein